MGLNPVWEAFYDSLQINLAYDLEGKLRYICFSQHRTPFDGAVTFRGINLFTNQHVIARLLAHDPEPLEWCGFIFFMKLGLRLEGFHTPVESGLMVSLFERGRYDSKRDKFTPFQGSV